MTPNHVTVTVTATVLISYNNVSALGLIIKKRENTE